MQWWQLHQLPIGMAKRRVQPTAFDGDVLNPVRRIQRGILASNDPCTFPFWTCSDSLSYSGYDYATVLIGDQCWHVPAAGEWNDLESHISNQGFEGIEGAALKAENGWNNSGNGFDEYGFTGRPGGFRHRENGQFVEGGNTGYFLSSTLNTYASYRRLFSGSSTIIVSSSWPRAGLSIRCIKD